MVYYLLSVLLPAAALFGALTDRWGVRLWSLRLAPWMAIDAAITHEPLVAAFVAVGPVAAAALVHLWATARHPSPPPLKKRLFAPFHGEAFIGSLGLHTVAAAGLLTILPIYHLVLSLLLPPGHAPVFSLWPAGSAALKTSIAFG